jgi:hypothetical protein
MHSPPTITSWLRAGLSACVIAVASLTVGVALSVLAIVPALSELTPSEATPRWDASRFERLVLDVNAPDPPPYRTATPDFGISTPPGYGAIARANARGATERRATKVRSRSGPSQISRQAADAFAFSPAPSTDRPAYPQRDRHTMF